MIRLRYRDELGLGAQGINEIWIQLQILVSFDDLELFVFESYQVNKLIKDCKEVSPSVMCLR